MERPSPGGCSTDSTRRCSSDASGISPGSGRCQGRVVAGGAEERLVGDDVPIAPGLDVDGGAVHLLVDADLEAGPWTGDRALSPAPAFRRPQRSTCSRRCTASRSPGCCPPRSSVAVVPHPAGEESAGAVAEHGHSVHDGDAVGGGSHQGIVHDVVGVGVIGPPQGSSGSRLCSGGGHGAVGAAVFGPVALGFRRLRLMCSTRQRCCRRRR